jgi:O-antigen ligase
VIGRNFWFGSVDYLQTPEMQSMMQGQGIIDIVNSYIGVTLNYGVTGLALFAGFFLTILLSLYRVIRAAPDRTREDIRLGRALLAAWLGIMVMIFTVSSIFFVPYIYWTVGGIAVAYLQMMKNSRGKDLHA